MTSNNTLDGRIAVVTGAAGAFGRRISRTLVEAGARVALWDIDGDRVTAEATAIAKYAGTGVAIGVRVDVGDPGSVDAAASVTRTELGAITLLVNNAAIVAATDPWDVTTEDWSRTFRVNADGPFFCIRACLPDMREQRYGKIVNIGSLAAQHGRPSVSPAYAASKGAVLALTTSLSRTLGEYGICVNAINPGFIRTEIHEAFTAEQLEVLQADIPLHRHGRPGEHGVPQDIADAVLYLASPASDYVSGEFLSVNGATRTG